MGNTNSVFSLKDESCLGERMTKRYGMTYIHWWAIFISKISKRYVYRFFTDSEWYQSFEIIILSIFKIKLENDLYKE